MTNFVLTVDQKNTLHVFRNFLQDPDEKYMIIQGAAGSGKSTLITHLDAILDAQHKMYSLLLQKNKTKSRFEVLLSATTNKAVAVLDELTNLSARTIHSLLGLKITFNPTTGERMLSKKNGYAIKYNKLVIIDESSMINEELFKIIDETFKDSKIVFIGDQYQLAPVKQKISIMESMSCTKVTMNKIMRNSGNILKTGAQFRETVETGVFKPISLSTDIINLEKKEYLEQIDIAFGSKKYIHNQSKVLTWTNDQALKYNSYIRAIKGYPLEFQMGEIAITNNPIMSQGYMWPVDSAIRISKITENACEQGVPGRYIEVESHVSCFMANNTYEQKQLLTALAKEKRWKDYYKIKENWLDLRSSYASTIHKAQGSTYDVVFIDLENIGYCNIPSDVARLLYVAISRSKKRVIFYGQLPDHYCGK